MKLVTLILVLVCYTRHAFPYALKTPIAYTSYGQVIGSMGLSRNKREFMSFRGIPYAKPPVGELRFKAPEPIEPWNFAINATKDAPYCIQKDDFIANPQVEGSEDCLYLNIYAPVIEHNDSLLPVMVFIHWGGFFAGRGSSDIIGPEYMMDKDVILVTFNYRLGVFGFFSTLDDAAPGNFGLKDQVQALKFVQNVIECFGGDKNKVTVFGQSAGGGSVSLHLISPASEGLFHQGISQSGVALDLWARPGNVVQPMVIAALAKFTECDDHLGNNTNLVNCLRKIDAAELTKTADKFKYFYNEPLTPYTVVVEKKTTENPHPFLTKDPLQSLQTGEFRKIPWIVGGVEDEGILRVAPLTRQPEILNALNANFTTLIYPMLALRLSAGANATQLFDNIDQFYLENKTFIDINDPKSVQGFINLYSDRSFNYGIYQTVAFQSKHGHKPIWMYTFNYKGQYTYGDIFATTKNNFPFNWGVCHCDDLLYLFRTPAFFPDLKNAADLRVSDHLLTLWTNFATYGNPDPHQKYNWKSLNFLDLEKIKHSDFNVFNIVGSYDTDTKYQSKNGFFKNRMAFWEKQNIAENVQLS